MKPFVEALTKMHCFYNKRLVDVFKQSMSAFEIARILLFRAARTANASFMLFNKRNEDLYHTVKKFFYWQSIDYFSKTNESWRN